MHFYKVLILFWGCTRMIGASEKHYFSHSLLSYNTFLPSLAEMAQLVPGLMKARIPKN